MPELYRAQLHFPSTEHTYIKPITNEVDEKIALSKVDYGLCMVSSPHTTMGLIVQEIVEPNLVKDLVEMALKDVPEDRRSSHATAEFRSRFPVEDYFHRCQDNPRCDLIDEDYNAASHGRCLRYAQYSVTLAILAGRLNLGKYQDLAVFEFDGRDGTGKNPIRQRTVQIWIYEVEEVTELK